MDFRSDLERYDDNRPRTQQAGVGPSSVDTCIRKAAYRWHRTPPTDDLPRAAARLGTLLHLGYAVVTTALYGAHCSEVAIDFGDGLTGTADAVDWEREEVTDLKSLSARGWDYWVTHGPPDHAWDQAEIYGYGLWQVHGGNWTLVILAFNRETGMEAPFARAADPERGARLLERLRTKKQAIETSAHPEDLPREGSGPDRGFPCDWCEWVTACWPAAEFPLTPQSATIADDPEMIAAYGEDYLTAGALKAKAEAAQKDARAFLTGLPAGTYGGITLSWRGGREKPPEPDPDAMREALEDLGEPVPLRTTRTPVQIHVGRTPPAPVDTGAPV